MPKLDHLTGAKLVLKRDDFKPEFDCPVNA